MLTSVLTSVLGNAREPAKIGGRPHLGAVVREPVDPHSVDSLQVKNISTGKKIFLIKLLAS